MIFFKSFTKVCPYKVWDLGLGFAIRLIELWAMGLVLRLERFGLTGFVGLFRACLDFKFQVLEPQCSYICHVSFRASKPP